MCLQADPFGECCRAGTPERFPLREEDYWQIRGSGSGGLQKCLCLVVDADRHCAIRDLVHGQEGLQFVGSRRPLLAQHANAFETGAIPGLPIAEEVVEDRVQMILGRMPGLHDVLVEPNVVDCADRCVGVGVCR